MEDVYLVEYFTEILDSVLIYSPHTIPNHSLILNITNVVTLSFFFHSPFQVSKSTHKHHKTGWKPFKNSTYLFQNMQVICV